MGDKRESDEVAEAKAEMYGNFGCAALILALCLGFALRRQRFRVECEPLFAAPYTTSGISDPVNAEVQRTNRADTER